MKKTDVPCHVVKHTDMDMKKACTHTSECAFEVQADCRASETPPISLGIASVALWAAMTTSFVKGSSSFAF
jgi:hypothetical protein